MGLPFASQSMTHHISFITDHLFILSALFKDLPKFLSRSTDSFTSHRLRFIAVMFSGLRHFRRGRLPSLKLYIGLRHNAVCIVCPLVELSECFKGGKSSKSVGGVPICFRQAINPASGYSTQCVASSVPRQRPDMRLPSQPYSTATVLSRYSFPVPLRVGD